MHLIYFSQQPLNNITELKNLNSFPCHFDLYTHFLCLCIFHSSGCFKSIFTALYRQFIDFSSPFSLLMIVSVIKSFIPFNNFGRSIRFNQRLTAFFERFYGFRNIVGDQIQQFLRNKCALHVYRLRSIRRIIFQEQIFIPRCCLKIDDLRGNVPRQLGSMMMFPSF